MTTKLAHDEFIAESVRELARERGRLAVRIAPLQRKSDVAALGRGPELTAEEDDEFRALEDDIADIDLELFEIANREGKYDFDRWREGQEAEAARFRES